MAYSTVHLTPEVYERLKRAAREGRHTIGGAAELAIIAWLKSRPESASEPRGDDSEAQPIEAHGG